ncbi:hypothetical protein A9Q83_04325 [Alphaproteobacteria bacterium 46_93_T64]|nr:hypothetical protein A9Q83_04325 [Alphaproteobacteria bacterium 46_93_T64]
MLRPRTSSSLNLTLEGSVGSFNIGTGKVGQNSLEVRYFLTHMGLDFTMGSSEELLKHLAPVREMFDFEELDFDEIMQRDIDDSRVSGELIPYLLDANSHDLVKLFPPIVVVVLPTLEGTNKPANLYPSVENFERPPEGEIAETTQLLRSGSIGAEVFQFEQPIVDGRTLKHDLVRLKLNTNKAKLVIVDGQHRAMALLALYRNLKDDWSDAKRSPFKEYYEEWTPAHIEEFNLTEINLPVMFCTFPQICEGYKGDLDLKQAARAIFLTLNKTARRVSNSRNILLDDSDLVAVLLRRSLSEIKKKHLHSKYSLRIYNVELDQTDNRLKILSPIAITGVNHVYYITEHLLLNGGDNNVNGAKPRSGNFSNRTDLNAHGAMDRLTGRDLLGAELAESTTRVNFTKDAINKLGPIFDEKYGKYIISAFEKFAPYEIHNQAVLELDQLLDTNGDRRLRPILFEGQGIARVFEDHRTNLKQKIRDGEFRTDAPQIKALSRKLDSTAQRISDSLLVFRKQRTENYIVEVAEKNKLKKDGEWHPKLIILFNELYDNVFTTVAFEAALVCSFFGELERANKYLKTEKKAELDTNECFDEYIKQLNAYFIPKTVSKFKRLVRLFVGDFVGEISDWKISKSPHTFRSVVFRGEMQPNQWPKYKYLLLELWKPSNESLAKLVSEQREICRLQVFTSLYESNRADFAKENSMHEDTLEKEQRTKIFDTTYAAFKEFMKIVDRHSDIPGKAEMHKVIEGASEDAGAVEAEGESWESADEE